MTEFAEVVRRDVHTILSRQYNTVRHGGHIADTDEFLHTRPFWPDMLFHDVDMVDGPAGDQIRITFTPTHEPGVIFGYKVDVEDTANAWIKRVGIRDPRDNTPMFAAEIIWYMIAYIGVTELVQDSSNGDGVQWINNGDDVFAPLPDPLAFQDK